MKTYPLRSRAAWLLIVAFGTAPAFPVRAEDAIEKAFRDALYAEEVKGDSEAALKAYQEVGAKFETQRDMAATALFRQGECLRKLGRKEEAAAAYNKVLSLYGDRERVAKLSRENLTALGLPAPSANPAAPAPTPAEAVDEDAKEISRLKNIAENSPDLLTQGELEKAAYNASPAVITWLLEKLPKPLSAESLSAALAAASTEGHLKICQLLLDAGASPDGRGAWFPFWAAAESKRLEVMKLLISRKADVNFRRDINSGYDSMAIPEKFSENLQMELTGSAVRPGKFTFKGAVPLIAAIMGGDTRDVLDLLLKSGADPNVTVDLIKPPSSVTDSSGVRTLVTPPPYPLTPLGAAILRGNVETVGKLIEAKADPNKPFGYNAGTPLLFALMMLQPDNAGGKEAHERSEKIIEALLGAGADWKAAFSNGAGALHECARLNLTTWLERGIKAGVDVNARDKKGNTALHCAVRVSSPTAVQMLLAAGAKPDPEADANAPVSPLTIACSSSERDEDGLSVVKMLLDAGADPNRSKDKATLPLSAAMRSGKWYSGNLWSPVADLLIERGARPAESRMLEDDMLRWEYSGNPRMLPNVVATFRKAWKAAHLRDNPRLNHAVWLSQSESLLQTGLPPVFTAVLSDEAPVSRPPTLREFFCIAPVSRERVKTFGFVRPEWEEATVIRMKEGKEERLPVNVRGLVQEPAKNDVALEWGDVVEIPVKLERQDSPDPAKVDAENRLFAPMPVEVRIQPAKDRVVTNEEGPENRFRAGVRRGAPSYELAQAALRVAGIPGILFDGFSVKRTGPDGAVSIPDDKQVGEARHGDILMMRPRPSAAKPDEEALLSSIWICQSADGPHWSVPPWRNLEEKPAPLAGLMVALLGPHPFPSPCFDWEKATVRWFGPPPAKSSEASKKDKDKDKDKEAPRAASVWNEKRLLDAWPSLRMEPGMIITLPPSERDSFEPPAKLRAALTSALAVDWVAINSKGEEFSCRYEPRFFKGAKKDGLWVWRDLDPAKANGPLLPAIYDLVASQPRLGIAPDLGIFVENSGHKVSNYQDWLTVSGTRIVTQ